MKTTTIERQLRKLNLIFKFTILKPEMFYNVRFDNHTLTLQGYYNSEIVYFCIGKKFESEVRQGNIFFEKTGIRIVLTEEF